MKFVGLLVLVVVLAMGAQAKYPLSLIEGGFPPVRCNSTEYSYNCCDRLDFKVDIPFRGPVHINDTFCASITLNPANNGTVTVMLQINDQTVFADTVPLEELTNVCVPLYLVIGICLKFSNLHYDSNTRVFTGCTDLDAQLAGVTVADIPLGCFKLRAPALIK